MPLFTNHMELGNLSSRPACKRSDVDVDQRERVEATLSNLVAASKTRAMSAGMSLSPSLMRRCTQAAATYVSPSLSATNGFAPSLRSVDKVETMTPLPGSLSGHVRKPSAALSTSSNRSTGGGGAVHLAALTPLPPIANAVAGSMRVVGPFPLHGGTFYTLVSATTAGVRGDVQALAEFDEAAAALKRILAPWLCFFADQQIDHSPTGSCVMARVALGVDQGRLQIGESIVSVLHDGNGFCGTAVESFVVKEHDMMPDGFTITLPS
ncbi:hypothetical protein B0H14DRAFT_3462245 [Mycena olivaceomarginata]|nr:hypothetical protein B0H14DRAFT_3462245 [Mycena olivaceomarginata]